MKKTLKRQIKSIIPLWLKEIILTKIKNIKNPYTKYDDKYQCIFIHIPKAAGISVSKALFDTNIGHRKIKYFEIFDKNKFNNYFKFTFVRNPWSRIVSAYNFLKLGGRNEVDKKWAKNNLAEFNTFESFILSLKDKKQAKKILKWQHFTPQYEYICDDRLNIKVDFVGRLKNINEDYKYIKNKIGAEGRLQHLNKSDHRDYKEYYTEETRNIVYNIYRKDIELLGYKFGG